MSGNLQPKGLYELAFKSFITYMGSVAQQLMKLDPSPEAVTVTSRVCGELKRFFHSFRLPTSMTNQLTTHLLIKLLKLYNMYKSFIPNECGQQKLLSLVEVFMHPDVTAIELGPSYFHGYDLNYCCFISWAILTKVCNLHNLKVLNLPREGSSRYEKHTFVFPSQLQDLTVRGSILHSEEDILRSIVESCPELKGLTMYWWDLSDECISLILQCKHLETLRLSNIWFFEKTEDIFVTLINGLSTDDTSDLLSASTLKSFYSKVGKQNTLNLIVDKLPHLTEFKLFCSGHIDVSSLTQFKNLRSLSLEPYTKQMPIEYKKILPVLGKNLMFLEMVGFGILDLEFIAETCTHLKCLHVRSKKCTEVNSSSKTFENFKTVECLNVQFEEDANHIAAFLIAHCTNIKRLTVDMRFTRGTEESPLYRTTEDVLRRKPALDWIVIKHMDHHNFVESLLSRHPNFYVVKTPHGTRLSSQAEVFD